MKKDLAHALNELNTLTGISLELHCSNEEDAALALEQIHALKAAYKEKYNKDYFLRSVLSGRLAPEKISGQADKFHISPNKSRVLFLLESRSSWNSSITSILKNLLPSSSGNYLIPMDDTRMAILYPFSEQISETDLYDIACMIVDTLNTEALVPVWIAYSKPTANMAELSSLWEEVCFTLKTGKIFYSGHTVFPYNKLGIAQLIPQLPTECCMHFLEEIWGKEIPSEVDSELLQTVDRFLQNNLNIAETARQLHMHRNTLIYRIEQIEKRTHLDLRTFEDAMTYKFAVMILQYVKHI